MYRPDSSANLAKISEDIMKITLCYCQYIRQPRVLKGNASIMAEFLEVIRIFISNLSSIA
jgi:hypothetical protein